ncbi:CLIPD6.2 family protein [Megaselia abdita]
MKCLLLVLTLFSGQIWCQRSFRQVDNRASNCQGPDRRPGNCMDVRKCPELLDALVYDSQNATVANILRTSNEICRNNGYIEGNSVCCPNGAPGPNPNTTPNPRTNGNGRVSLNGPECGLSKVSEFRKVVGGVDAKLGAYPWITLLGYDVLEGSPFKCGGSLITQRHVLTAAHCIRSDLKFVRLGEHDLGQTSETRTVDVNIVKMDRHPQYNSRNGKNDLAVLHLASPVAFTDAIHPACLPKDEPLRSRSFVAYTPFVAGWGRTEEGGKSSEILQELQLPVLANQVCREKYAAQRRLVTEDQFDNAVICAGFLEGGMDTCQGDSGGPLMYPYQTGSQFRFNVIGVVSYGVGCARAEIPGVYTNVANFIDWIEEKISV